MRWSLQVGRLFGIQLNIHYTFFLLLGFLGFAALAATGSWAYAAFELAFVLLLFGVVVLHELGHALAAKAYGIRTRDITLLPIGGLARLERIPREPVRELVIAVAGPLVNVAIALGLFVGNVLATGASNWEFSDLLEGDLVSRLFWLNVVLAVFNMLPAFPMDGGRVLRALLAMAMDHSRATRIAAGIGQGVAVLFALWGFLGGPPMMVLVALFVWMGAAQEAALAQTRIDVAGATVQGAMATRFETLAPFDSLGHAVQLSLDRVQRDFPVVENGKLAGMARGDDLLEALERFGPEAPVQSAMQPVRSVVRPMDLIEDAIDKLQEENVTSLPVVEMDGRLVGLFTVDNLREFLTVRRMLQGRPGWLAATGRAGKQGAAAEVNGR